MQTLLLPVVRSGTAASVGAAPTPPLIHRVRHRRLLPPPNSIPISHKSTQALPSFSYSSSLSSYDHPRNKTPKNLFTQTSASNATAPAFNSQNDEAERAKLAQVAKRLENTSRYFKRLGSLGFWGQLICSTVAAVILSFSVIFTGKITSPPTFYATIGGIAAAFISVFWSFGYIRLSEKLRKTANDPSKLLENIRGEKNFLLGITFASIWSWECTLVGLVARQGLRVPCLPMFEVGPFMMIYDLLNVLLRFNEKSIDEAPPRADVVKSLKNGIILNLLGMGSAILGMQATVGLLVAKALTSPANPYYQQISPGYSPVLALDVFLVQASANTILSHFLGLVFTSELLRSVTLPPSENIPVFKVA
ncbi:hypothetical protein SADUNF_Sadunf16G0181800 [Salix dunnii]|uniref:Protein TIC 21, chloroplastic n=1 Tax=Salix dunnii TaxID=1413687 RepID=A0A835JCS0_9ROSI|nr:hypothetical protein SADUNF_Sadunf16G0181800 [Salix dunnii]